MADIEWYQYVLRLLLAVFAGGAIGFERELHGRPAGLRTHVLVSLGAAFVMLVSMYGFGGVGDPARLAAQVVSGIGFLGAGAIIHDNGDIKGITTAATLWLAAILGLGAGAGGAFFYITMGTTVAAVVVLSALRTIEKYLGKRNHHLVVICDARKPVLQTIVELCEAKGLEVKNIDATLKEYGNIKCLKFSADFTRGTPKKDVEKVVFDITNALDPLSITIN